MHCFDLKVLKAGIYDKLKAVFINIIQWHARKKFYSVQDQFSVSQYLSELTTNKKLPLVAVDNFKSNTLFLSLQKALLKLLTTEIIHSVCYNVLSTWTGMALWEVLCLLHKRLTNPYNTVLG